MDLGLIVLVCSAILCGVAFGAVVSYLLLIIQKRPWPLSFASLRPGSSPPHWRVETPGGKNLWTARLADIQLAWTPPTAAQSAGPSLAVDAKKWPANLAKSQFMLEIENNLSRASAPGKTGPAFETLALDSEKTRIEKLQPELKKVLTAAYNDMHIANALLRIYSRSEQGSQRIEASYRGLCHKIVESLEQVVDLADSGI
jgi:hypothetical protein